MRLTNGLTLPLTLLQTILVALAVITLLRIGSNVDLIAEDIQTTYFLNIEEHRGSLGLEVIAVPVYGRTVSAANREFDQQVSLSTPVEEDCEDCVFERPDSTVFLLYKDIRGEQELLRDTTLYNR